MGPTRGGVFHWDFNITHARFNIQWPCNRNRLIGGTDSIYKAYVLGLNFREYPSKIWSTIWYVYVPPSVGSFFIPIEICFNHSEMDSGDGSRTKTGFRVALRGYVLLGERDNWHIEIGTLAMWPPSVLLVYYLHPTSLKCHPP